MSKLTPNELKDKHKLRLGTAKLAEIKKSIALSDLNTDSLIDFLTDTKNLSTKEKLDKHRKMRKNKEGARERLEKARQVRLQNQERMRAKVDGGKQTEDKEVRPSEVRVEDSVDEAGLTEWD